jgi:hypothetical protein
MFIRRSYYKSKGIVIPGRVLFQGTPYFIKYLHPSYHIKKYFIIVNNKRDNIFEDLIIFKCYHPNALGGEERLVHIDKPPKYSKFCLPDWVKGSKFINSDDHRKMLKGLLPMPDYNVISDMYLRMAFLSIWVLDNPHHEPLSEYVKTEPKLPFF